jgi:hypothetical protein
LLSCSSNEEEVNGKCSSGSVGEVVSFSRNMRGRDQLLDINTGVRRGLKIK